MDTIEGTILTQGGNSGSRGTRFATYASNRALTVGGVSGGIRGGQGGILSSTGLAIDINSMKIRPRMENPLEVKPMVTGGGVTQDAVESSGVTLARSAANYADRVDTSRALEAILSFKDFARESYYGNDDGSIPGFSALKGQAAVSARGDYFSSIDKKLAEVVGSLDPAAKQKAITRLYSVRDEILNKAAGHVVQAQHDYEIQLKAREVEDITRDLVIDSSKASSLKDQLSAIYGIDTKAANTQWDSGVINAAHRVYMNRYNNNESGVADLKAFRDSVKDTVSTKALNILDSFISSQKKEEKTAAKAAEAEAKKALLDHNNNSIRSMYKGIDSGKLNVRNATDVYNLNPNLKRTDVAAIIDYANEKRVPTDSVLQERITDFKLNVVDKMLLKGETFQSSGELLSAAKEYGILDSSKVDSLWKTMSSPLTQDEKVLKEQRSEIVKRLDAAFHGGEGSVGFDSNKGFILQGRKKVDPPELQTIKNNIVNITENTQKTPYERSQDLEKYIDSELKKEGAPKELNSVKNLDILASSFRVKSYVHKLQQNEYDSERVKSGVYQNISSEQSGSQYGDFVPSEQEFLNNSFHIDPTIVNRDMILKSFNTSGIKDAHFVDRMPYQLSGGERVLYTGYVGEVKQKDGSYKLQRIGIRRKK